MTQLPKVKTMPSDPEARLQHLAKVTAQSLTIEGIDTTPELALKEIRTYRTRRLNSTHGRVQQ